MECRISYDYEELIRELKEEVEDGILKLTDYIDVVRGTEIEGSGYRPIIDWYYVNGELSEEEVKQYVADAQNIETMLLGNVLIEIEEKNKVID